MYNEVLLSSTWRTAPLRGIKVGVGVGIHQVGENKNVIVLTANLLESMRLAEFVDAYGDRFFDVGVSEQNMAGVAAGLAFEGYVPYITSFATFSPGRNWEQVRVSLALNNANVKIIGGHAGAASGILGPSHQALEDIAITRVLPNMTVLVPTDATQASAMVIAAYNHPGPVYIRSIRPESRDFTKSVPYVIGTAQIYREGADITICASGIQVWDCLMVAEELAKEGIECEVINVSSIKPIDSATIISSAKKTGKVITVEDHQVAGGMGSAVAELLGEKHPVPVKRIGVDDRFGVSGEWTDVYKMVGLDSASIKKAVVDWFHE